MDARTTCPACGTVNDAANAYCGACGAALRPAVPPRVSCWNCRSLNPPGRAYCGSCGQPLAPGTVAASRPDRGRNPVLLALAIVLMAFLLIASIFLIVVIMDDRGGGIIGNEPTPSLTEPPHQTEPPHATPTPHPTETPLPTPTLRPTPAPTPTLGPPPDYVCFEGSNRSRQVLGPTGSKWALYQVDFRTYRDYDRVIYQLRRTDHAADELTPAAEVSMLGSDSGAYVGAPSGFLGDTRLNVLLVNGVRDRARLDPPYEPRGMRIVEALGTTPYRSHVNYADPSEDPRTGDVGTLSTIDVRGEGCFALRVVGWDGQGDDTASVYVDIRH